MSLPPIRTSRRLVEPLWGGTRLASWLGLPEPHPASLGESWQVYGSNLIVGGPYAGQSLADLAAQHGPELVGLRTVARYGVDFPLLAKFLDASDHLSIQVHPDDAYAQRYEAHTGFYGKTEAWYILDAAPGANVIYGLNRACSREEFAHAVAHGSVEKLMAYLPVQPGDLIFVPPGTFHAINAGIMLFEIQQKSDLTYRVYDYGHHDQRTGRPRELHLDRALEVGRFAPLPDGRRSALQLDRGRDLLVACHSFALERRQLTEPVTLQTDPGSFEIWTLIDGDVELIWGREQTLLTRGDSLVLPASLGRYTLRSARPAILLNAYVPHLELLAAEAHRCGADSNQISQVIIQEW